MKGTKENPFENIFEAIESIDPENILLSCYSHYQSTGKILHSRPSDSFEVMELPDGTLGAFQLDMTCTYYRGEPADYPSCSPSLHRLPNEKAKVIARLRATEFELDMQPFNQIIFSKMDSCHIDYTALSQHYGFATDYIDITSRLEVAAFFATQKYIGKDGYIPQPEGIGRIRIIPYILNPFQPLEASPFKLIGLQPFMRPGRQAAFAIKLNQNKTLDESASVFFQQDKNCGHIINQFFKNTANGRALDSFWIFPKEAISDAAERIKTSKAISKKAIETFCRKTEYEVTEIEQLLTEAEIKIAPTPIFTLSKREKQKTINYYKSHPYGDVKLYSRLLKIE